MTQNSSLIPSGESSRETEENRPGMRSSNGSSIPEKSDPPILDMSAITPTREQSQKDSLHTPNSVEVSNAVNMIGALAATKPLKALGVGWRRLELSDGTPVFALVFPESSWELTPDVKLVPKAPNALGVGS